MADMELWLRSRGLGRFAERLQVGKGNTEGSAAPARADV